MKTTYFIPNLKSKNKLIDSQVYDQSILNGLAAGISIVDRNMRIAWINRRMARAFGPIKKLAGTHCYRTYNHKKRICSNCPTVKTFKSGKVSEGIQIGFTKSGEKRYYYLTAAPIRDEKGQIIQVMELVQDITNKKRIEEKLSRAYQEVSQRFKVASEELKTIFGLSQAMISTLNLRKVLSAIVKNASLIMGGRTCSVKLLDRYGNTLSPTMNFGLNLDYTKKASAKIGRKIAGLVVLKKKPIVINNIDHNKRVEYAHQLIKEGVRSVLGVPIIFNSQPLGVLVTYSSREHQFSTEEIGLFSTFASQAAIAINNARMHENLHRIYLSAIKALVLAMEARSPYMKGHSKRVTRYAIKIARHMQLNEPEIDIIRYCANIHDVGKIAIPDEILNKPGKLTHSERIIIQQHPAKAQEMLLPLKFLEPGMPVVRHHHERYDGKGYPDGLGKKKIPLGARILSTVDAFDAMISERPYRHKLSLKQAIKELKVNAGSQFDPEVVKIFLKLLEQA